jgi:hypothetical protein
MTGGDASFFHKRRVERQGTAVNEGMIGDFERLATALGCGSPGHDFFVSEVGLKIQGIAGIPFLLASDGGDVLLTEYCRVFAIERLEFQIRWNRCLS